VDNPSCTEAHCTSCRSYQVVCACASARSVTWWEVPHPQVSRAGQVSAAPAAGLRGPRLRSRPVISVRRHRRVPLLREISRSSRATCYVSSAFCVFSAAICASLSSSSTRSRTFSARSVTASPGTPPVPGISGTPELHQSRALRNQHDTLSQPANVLNPHERQHRHVTSALPAQRAAVTAAAPRPVTGEEPRSAVDADTAAWTIGAEGARC